MLQLSKPWSERSLLTFVPRWFHEFVRVEPSLHIKIVRIMGNGGPSWR